MSTDTLESLADLGQLDLATDLQGRTLRITAHGAAWETQRGVHRLTREELLRLYYFMGLTRAVDVEMVKLSRKGLALGKSPRCLGNEATAVGASICLQPQEWCTLAIRDLGAFLAKTCWHIQKWRPQCSSSRLQSFILKADSVRKGAL